jgi:hypothetical protein
MSRLRGELQQKGFSVWTDETGLERGSPRWEMIIEREIEQAYSLVVILSPSAKSSEWVRREIKYANDHQIPIYPLLVKGNKRTAVPLILTDHDWLDARQRYSRALSELCYGLSELMGRESGMIKAPTTSSFELRARKMKEIVEAMGGNFAIGRGQVGRIWLYLGLSPAPYNSYRAIISPIDDPDVLEAGRRLELRGWQIKEHILISGRVNDKLDHLAPKGMFAQAYVYDWMQTYPNVAEIRMKVASELLAANELLGLWPEDVLVNIALRPGIGTNMKPPDKNQSDEDRGLLDRFMDFIDDL